MSRMLAYIAPRPMTTTDALGASTMDDFLALSALHGDGWGHASLLRADTVRVSTGVASARAGLQAGGAQASRIAIDYLRFASAGSAVSTANLQPFEAGGIAFAHNGALVPRESIEHALDERERAALRGSTDSEMYFTLVRRHLQGRLGTVESSVAAGVAEVRSFYPAACLNAMLIVEDALVVVHSRGTVDPPLRAFADRGVELGDLPPGHDHTYNTLFTCVLPTGARAVSTTGIALSQWAPLEDDTVYVFTADAVPRTARVTTRGRPRSNQPPSAATGSA